MKGVTHELRELGSGEQVFTTKTSRANLYMLARRLGIRVSVEKSGDGFLVTRTDHSRISFDDRTSDVVTDFDFGA